MADILRIQDRFNITGRGLVYTAKYNKGAIIRIGDLFYDLQGHRFKVKGVEMFRRCFPDVPFDELPIGIMFELLDGEEITGNILVSELKEINFLFCNHPLYAKRVDMDYETEYQEAGLNHSCGLFSYEDLENGKLSLYGEEITGLTIYRGWMMKPEMYETFFKLLEEKGIFLINSPEEYKRYHTLPGWYNEFSDQTVESIWEEEGNVNDILEKSTSLEGSYIVKDFVKSRKHEWYDACYIPNIADKLNASKVITTFAERQGKSLVGGIVLRKFVKLKQIGFHEKSGMPISEEYRVFVYAGKVHIMDNYWNDDSKVEFSEDELVWIEEIATKVRSNFVTVDLARKEDGTLIIMELGDGQVSGLQEIDEKAFYDAFAKEQNASKDEKVVDDVRVLISEPMPDITIDEMRAIITKISSVQELVDAYVNVHNKFWYIEDDVYDYEEGTLEYNEICSKVALWRQLMNSLDDQILRKASEEGLLMERKEGAGTVAQLTKFMDKYGYKNGSGWWIKNEN